MLSPRLDAAKAVLVLAVWWSMEATALAHPHIFVEATSTIELDQQDRIARIRHEWTFDPLFSSWLSQGIARDGEGRLDSGRLDEIGRGDVENLHAYGYYTSVLNDGASLAFVADGPVTLSEDDGRLRLRFAIVPKQEIPSQGRLSVSVFDPQYYTAISFAASEGVKIAGGSGACDMAHEEGQALPDSVQARLRQLPANVYQLPPELAAAIGGSQAQLIIACGAEKAAKPSFEILPGPMRTAHLWTVPPTAATAVRRQEGSWYESRYALFGGLAAVLSLGAALLWRMRTGRGHP